MTELSYYSKHAMHNSAYRISVNPGQAFMRMDTHTPPSLGLPMLASLEGIVAGREPRPG